MLGRFSIVRANDAVVSLGIAGPTLELLAYLICNNQRFLRRDHLIDLLWEDLDAEHGRAALNTALWRVRQVICAVRGLNLLSEASAIRLQLDGHVQLDTSSLRNTVQRATAAFINEVGLPPDLRVELDTVLPESEGSFLDGATANWVLVEREEYGNLHLRGLTMLMQDAGMRSQHEDALSYGRRILAADPFREAVQCEMLWLYVMSGQRASAIRHYREYARMLRSELAIAPMEETRIMYEMICADDMLPRAEQRLPDQLAPGSSLGQRLVQIEIGRRTFYRNMVAPGGAVSRP